MVPETISGLNYHCLWGKIIKEIAKPGSHLKNSAVVTSQDKLGLFPERGFVATSLPFKEYHQKSDDDEDSADDDAEADGDAVDDLRRVENHRLELFGILRVQLRSLVGPHDGEDQVGNLGQEVQALDPGKRHVDLW